MNFVGHIAAGRTTDRWASPGFRVGVVAPDLCSSAGFAAQAPTDAVSLGLAHHHRADAAFHGLAWFRATVQSMADDLQEAGVRRGPSRAAAHVGCELLIDGELLGQPAVAAALEETWVVLDGHGPEVAGLVAAGDRPSWARWLGMFLGAVDPHRYADPEVVAVATGRILGRRPRLAASEAELPAVAATLVAHAPAVRAGATAAVAEVVASMTPAPVSSGARRRPTPRPAPDLLDRLPGRITR